MDKRYLIQKAIKIVGSEARLGEMCNCSQHKIWLAKRSGRVAAELARDIHIATRGEVPGSSLRPDLWRLPEHVPIDAPSLGDGGPAGEGAGPLNPSPALEASR